MHLQGLCEWRDAIGRAEDESTGYILPNKVLLEIGIRKPVETMPICLLICLTSV